MWYTLSDQTEESFERLDSQRNQQNSRADVRQTAFLGDAVCHLFVREHLVREDVKKGLTRQAILHVSASAQSSAVKALMPMFNEEEYGIYRWGRNSHAGVVPKNTDPAVYCDATGWETLIGWLYLSNRRERMNELLGAAYEKRCEELNNRGRE